MASNYPSALDSLSLFPARTDLTATAGNHISDHNNLADAVIKIQTELGPNPKGSYASVASRITALSYNTETAPVQVNLISDGTIAPTLVQSYSSPTKLTAPGTLPTSNSSGVAWSPDGKYVAFASIATPYINIYERSGTTFTKLANPSSLPTSAALDIAWSSDGQFLALALNSSPYIAIYQRSGTTFTKLSDPASLPPGQANGISWSPDNRFLTIASSVSPYICTYERSGTTFTKLSNPGTLPAGIAWDCHWSPNGAYLAICHNTDPYITVYSRANTTFTKLSSPDLLVGSAVYGVSWSPDSKYMMLSLALSHGIFSRTGTTAFNFVGGGPTALTGTKGSWSPDGRNVAICSAQSPYITVYSKTGTTFTKLGNISSLPSGYSYDCGWSPDGRFLAVAHAGGSFLSIYETTGTVPYGPPTLIIQEP